MENSGSDIGVMTFESLLFFIDELAITEGFVIFVLYLVGLAWGTRKTLESFNREKRDGIARKDLREGSKEIEGLEASDS